MESAVALPHRHISMARCITSELGTHSKHSDFPADCSLPILSSRAATLLAGRERHLPFLQTALTMPLFGCWKPGHLVEARSCSTLIPPPTSQSNSTTACSWRLATMLAPRLSLRCRRLPMAKSMWAAQDGCQFLEWHRGSLHQSSVPMVESSRIRSL